MRARPLTKRDFDYIVRVIDTWWGGATAHLALPVFFYELGDMACVVEDGAEIIGFLLGLLTPQTPPVGYIHLVGVHPTRRRRGVGRFLYQWFESECQNRGAVSVKAITTSGHEGSILFHRSIGWNVYEVADYAGPGRTRVVFTKTL